MGITKKIASLKSHVDALAAADRLVKRNGYDIERGGTGLALEPIARELRDVATIIAHELVESDGDEREGLVVRLVRLAEALEGQ